MGALDLSAAQILAMHRPRPLFRGTTPEEIKAEYRALAAKWHPDKCSDPQAADVFAKITALRAIADGADPMAATYAAVDGKTYRMRYQGRYPFGLGEMLYAPQTVAFHIRKEYAPMADRLKVMSGLFKFDTKPRLKQRPYVPGDDKIQVDAKLKDGSRIVVMSKPKDTYLLRDVVRAAGGKLAPEHAAWIQSGLQNMCCYFENIGIVHNDLSMDTVFVSPSTHAIYVLGGWWFAARVGDPITSVPRRTANFAAPSDLAGKKASHAVDLALARVLGREVLGDASGMMLPRSGLPDALVKFLRDRTSGNAVKDYKAWEHARETSFGARRFVELDLKESDIFQ